MTPEAKGLPVLPALAFALRCAQLSLKHFENRWDDFYDDCAEQVIEIGLQIVFSPKGTKIMGPDGYADYCVDVSGLASKAGLDQCSHAANAAAGAGYCSAMISALNHGYASELSSNFYPNADRAIQAALKLDDISEQVATEYQRLSDMVAQRQMGDFDSVPRQTIEDGFKT